jgi:hypothetical protein
MAWGVAFIFARRETFWRGPLLHAVISCLFRLSSSVFIHRIHAFDACVCCHLQTSGHVVFAHPTTRLMSSNRVPR